MRRVLTLLLVLGIASSANALTVGLDPSGSGNALSIDVVSDTFNAGYDYFLVVADNTNGDIASVTALAAAGGDAVVSSMGALYGYDDVWQVKALDLNASTPHSGDIQIGTHFTATLNYTASGPVGGNLLIELVNGSLTQLDSYTHLIPEPATFLLLGLGVVTLRRKHFN